MQATGTRLPSLDAVLSRLDVGVCYICPDGTLGSFNAPYLKLLDLQPSELMKFFLVVALARYFHGLSQEEVSRPTYLLAPLIIIAMPVLLILP